MSTSFCGPINAASPTPLLPSGELDVASGKRLCKRWLDVGLDGVLVLGSMGEGLWLDDAVRNAFMELALAEAGDGTTLYANAADISEARMIERARRYAKMGAPCIVLCLPPKCSPAGGVAAIKRIADACPVPCAYYEAPFNTDVALTIGEIRDILSHPNVVAFKDSSSNTRISQGVSDPAHRPDAYLMHGCEYAAVFSPLYGYDGMLHGGGVMTARRVREVWDLVARGDMDAALPLHREKCLFLIDVYGYVQRPPHNARGQKYALKRLGIIDHEDTVIAQTLTDADRAAIARAVDANREWLA